MTDANSRDKSSERLVKVLGIGLAICALTIFLFRLESYPRLWLDEGIALQVSKNLVLYGEYALMYIPGELTRFDPAIQTGPTVVLPIALAFYLGGFGVLQARIVMVLYAVLALIALYWLVRSVCGTWVALLTVSLAIFTFDHEFTSFVLIGRQVLAEVPALAFFWLGSILWFRAWERSQVWALIWPGLLWGAAILTKIQFALVLPVTLIFFWVFDRISLKRLRVSYVLVPILISGGVLFCWYGYQAFSLGLADFWLQARALGSAGGIHFFRLVPRRMLGAIGRVMGSSLAVFGVPGILHAFYSSLQKRESVQHRLVFLATFTLVWLGWYATLSIGWMRYAFVPAAMSSIFSANLLVDLWRRAGRHSQELVRRLPLTPGQVAIVGIVAMLLLSGMAPMIKLATQNSDAGLQEMAEYLNVHMPVDAVIETWEWEMDLLSDQDFHHPPYEVLNTFTDHIWYGTPLSPALYNPLAYGPTHLILGPFSDWTGIYSQNLLAQSCTFVESIGVYRLYEVNADAR